MRVGVQVLTRTELERARARGRKLDFTAIGVLHVSRRVSPELAEEAVRRIRLWGVLDASPRVRRALADRIVRI